jgi:hypothetical protein
MNIFQSYEQINDPEECQLERKFGKLKKLPKSVKIQGTF